VLAVKQVQNIGTDAARRQHAATQALQASEFRILHRWRDRGV
jgi:hypothetical protein